MRTFQWRVVLTVLMVFLLTACGESEDSDSVDGDEDLEPDDSPDGDESLEDCGGHGVVQEDRCVCDEGYELDPDDILNCLASAPADGDDDPDGDVEEDPVPDCSGHGVLEQDRCVCDEGYVLDPDDSLACLVDENTCPLGPGVNGNGGWSYVDESSTATRIQLATAHGFEMEGVGFAWTADLLACAGMEPGRVSLSLRFLNEAGQEVAGGQAVVLSASPTRNADDLAVERNILDEDETGLAYFTANLQSRDIAGITRVEISLSVEQVSGLEAATAPTLEDVQVTTPLAGHWGLSGSVNNTTDQTVDDLDLFLFPRNEAGLLFGVMNPDVSPQSLAPGERGRFSESFGLVHQAFTEYEAFLFWSDAAQADGDEELDLDGDEEDEQDLTDGDEEDDLDGDEQELELSEDADGDEWEEDREDEEGELSTSCVADDSLQGECGIFHSATTEGFGNRVQDYSACTDTSYNGGETVYAWTAPCETQVRVGVSNMDEGSNLDILVLAEDCDGASCLDLANHEEGADYVWFVSEASKQYFFVVESLNQSGSFDLSVSCNCSASYEICDNGLDDDGLFGSDCEDPKCGHLPRCAKAFTDFTVPVICGDHFLGESNAEHGASNAVLDWCDAGTNIWSGPEMVYAFHFHASPPPPFPDKEVTVTLTSQSDVDLIVLSSLEPLTCLSTAGITAGSGEESVVFTAQAFQPYYFVVDGRDGTIGDYDIQVSCDPE